MSDIPDDLEEYPPDEESTRGSTTRRSAPVNPSAGGRRRIPADDVPQAYARPSLSRSRGNQPVDPPMARRPVTLPDTDESYAEPERRGRRREKRPKTRPPAPAKSKRESGLYLPWWSLLIMLVFVGCAAVGALLVVNSIGGTAPAGGQTPIVIVITSTFTVGPPASYTPIPQAATITPTKPLPTIPPTASLPPGVFAIGETVKVIGVGLNGLNVRAGPGTDQTIKFRASDDELFVLKEGPQTASGEEWWFIEDTKDKTKNGWASRRFLTVISSGGGATPQPPAQ
jgi:hypothetical protein